MAPCSPVGAPGGSLNLRLNGTVGAPLVGQIVHWWWHWRRPTPTVSLWRVYWMTGHAHYVRTCLHEQDMHKACTHRLLYTHNHAKPIQYMPFQCHVFPLVFGFNVSIVCLHMWPIMAHLKCSKIMQKYKSQLGRFFCCFLSINRVIIESQDLEKGYTNLLFYEKLLLGQTKSPVLGHRSVLKSGR